MAEQQYDISKKLYRLFQEKQVLRNRARDLFWKENTCPYKAYGSKPTPASLKYNAMLLYRVEHQKPVPKNIAGFLLCVILPCCVTFGILTHSEYSKESMYRTGQVAYADRGFKTLY